MAPIEVLFVCTGNSCRSIMAEALLQHLGGIHYRAHSAGSSPTGLVHPMAIECLTTNGITATGARSESWDRYREQPLNLVITVCDHAAGENCPIFPGDPHRIHWSIPDPALATGTGEQRAAIFQATFDELRARIEKLVLAIGSRDNAGSLPEKLQSLTDKAAD